MIPADAFMPRRAAELNVVLWARGALMNLAVATPDGVRQLWSARLEVLPPVRVAQTHVAENDLPPPGRGGLEAGADFFTRPVKLARQNMEGHAWQAMRLAEMTSAMDRAAEHLNALLLPRAVRAASDFEDPAAWWFVYEVAAGDASGRVAQLAKVCPGLLLMAHALRLDGARDACGRIVQGVARGRRLKQLLNLAASEWEGLRRHSLSQRRLRDLPARDRQRLVANQRLRIRRAGPQVPAGLLLMPPPPVLVPEDIPALPQPNRDWYIYTSHPLLPWQDWAAHLRMSRQQLEGLARFLSLQWPTLKRPGPVTDNGDPAWMLEHLADYLQHTGRVADRQTNARRLLRDMEDWVHQLGQQSRLPPETPLQIHGLQGWQGPRSSFEPLRTVGDLQQESASMKHCVAALSEDAVTGRAVFFHADLDGEPATVAVQPESGTGGWRLAQARGRCNRLLDGRQREVITSWLRRLGAGPGAAGVR